MFFALAVAAAVPGEFPYEEIPNTMGHRPLSMRLEGDPHRESQPKNFALRLRWAQLQANINGETVFGVTLWRLLHATRRLRDD